MIGKKYNFYSKKRRIPSVVFVEVGITLTRVQTKLFPHPLCKCVWKNPVFTSVDLSKDTLIKLMLPAEFFIK